MTKMSRSLDLPAAGLLAASMLAACQAPAATTVTAVPAPATTTATAPATTTASSTTPTTSTSSKAPSTATSSATSATSPSTSASATPSISAGLPGWRAACVGEPQVCISLSVSGVTAAARKEATPYGGYRDVLDVTNSEGVKILELWNALPPDGGGGCLPGIVVQTRPTQLTSLDGPIYAVQFLLQLDSGKFQPNTALLTGAVAQPGPATICTNQMHATMEKTAESSRYVYGNVVRADAMATYDEATARQGLKDAYHSAAFEMLSTLHA